MRDTLIALLLLGTALWALRQPWIGVMTWTLLSLGSPHTQFGYAASDWPVATGVAVCTLLGLLFTKEKQTPMVGPAPWCLVAFVVWTCITLPFSMLFDASYPLWERSMKIYLMIFVTLMLVNDKHKLNVFIWICVVSVGFYGVKGGVFTIASGGSYRVWGPGGFIEGNNEVALAVLTVIPLMRYLQQRMTDRPAIIAMTATMALCVVTVLGTYSRGALLGLIAMGLFFWLKGTRKMLWAVLILVMGIGGLALMPEAWWERMGTIQTYDEDASALGRINAWWMAFNLAKDNIFGGGFMIWTGNIFQIYAPVGDDPHAAHSIYFQIMGEHGFIGLFLFLAIGVSTWLTAGGLTRAGLSDPRFTWAAQLGPMIQVSMIGYGAAGAFLSLAYYDLPYNVMIMAALAKRFVQTEMAKPSVASGTNPQPLGTAMPPASMRSR